MSRYVAFTAGLILVASSGHAQTAPVLTVSFDKDFGAVGKDGPVTGTAVGDPVLAPGKFGQALKTGPATGYVDYPTAGLVSGIPLYRMYPSRLLLFYQCGNPLSLDVVNQNFHMGTPGQFIHDGRYRIKWIGIVLSESKFRGHIFGGFMNSHSRIFIGESHMIDIGTVHCLSCNC